MGRRSISKAYVRHYSDNGQTTAYIEWGDGARTEGPVKGYPAVWPLGEHNLGAHMAALFARARREGLTIFYQTW